MKRTDHGTSDSPAEVEQVLSALRAAGTEWIIEDYDPLDEAPAGDPETDCTGEPDGS